MSADGLNSCRPQKAKKAPRYFLIPTSRFELEYSVKAEKLGVPVNWVVPTPVPMFVTLTVPAPAKPPRV